MIPKDLPTLRTRYRSLLEGASSLPTEADADLCQEAAKLAEALLHDPWDEVVLHGDLHHDNIQGSSRGWLAIDPKGIRGERTYDFANWFYNPAGERGRVEDRTRVEWTANHLAEHRALDYRRLLAFSMTYGCLSACWAQEDGQNPAPALAVARILEKLVINSSS